MIICDPFLHLALQKYGLYEVVISMLHLTLSVISYAGRGHQSQMRATDFTAAWTQDHFEF